MGEFGEAVWYRGRNLVVETNPIYFFDYIMEPYNGSRSYSVPTGFTLKVMVGTMTNPSFTDITTASVSGNVVTWSKASVYSPVIVYAEVT